MKKSLSLLPLALGIYLNTQAQKIELSVQANTGMFRYTGISATDMSPVVYALKPEQSYTNDPYGNKNAVIFGGGLKAGLVTKKGFLLGVQIDYEELKSKVFLYEFPFLVIASSTYVNITSNPTIVGRTYLVSHFININPYIGYRIKLKKISIDVLPGLDIGLGINQYEDGKVEKNDYKLSLKREDPPTDVRLRLGTAITYNRLSLNASYAAGVTNYLEKTVGGGKPEAYSKLFRFGVGYRLY